MSMFKKLISCVVASAAIASTLALPAHAVEVPQKLVGENVIEYGNGGIVHEYIWEDYSATDIMPCDALDNATWKGISDDTSTGRHRSAKDYNTITMLWAATAETELNNASDNSPKYHYTRARIVNSITPFVIYSDSDRQWGTGHSEARTDEAADKDPGFALRSYWGY